jgi:hypothetical protein
MAVTFIFGENYQFSCLLSKLQPKFFKVQQPEGKKEIFEKKVATIISGKMHGAMRGGENTFSRHTLFLIFFHIC